jgi:arginyl-tRNA synthetase
MKQEIRKHIENALKELFPDENFQEISFDILYPPEEKFGDYSANIAMVLAKKLKKNPLEIAKEIAQKLEGDELFSRVEAVAPGFVNMFVSDAFLVRILRMFLEDEMTLVQASKKQSFLIEFISSNPTGPIHLGNARGGPSGDALARVLAYLLCTYFCAISTNLFE